MNSFSGKISEIHASNSFKLIKVVVNDITVAGIIISDDDSLKYHVGQSVNVIFNETEVILAKPDNLEIAIFNQVKGEIKEVQQGEILTRVVVLTEMGEVVAVISNESLKFLKLQIGENVMALIKTNEVMLET